MDSGGVDPEITRMSNPMRCLWISRSIPFPPSEGSKVYSANLAISLARTGVFVRFLGFGDASAVPESATGVEWLAVQGKQHNKILAAFSSRPIATAIDSTKAYSALLNQQLLEHWDTVVLDAYATGWALELCLKYRDENSAYPVVLVHVSHNHEEVLWRVLAHGAHGSVVKRWVIGRNARKVGALERRIVRSMDLVTTITEEDHGSISANSNHTRVLTLVPGFDGWVTRERHIDTATPRRAIILGSFRWIVKQENIATFIKIADPIFKEQGIELDVVGDMPQALLAALRARCRATHFHGFVSNVAPLLSSARIAIVHESFGGGFKLKLLDYIFARLPIAAVSQAVSGLSDELRRAMLINSNQAGLIEDIVSHIDQFDKLNRMQERAFSLGNAQFRWNVRGEQFRQAIFDVHAQRIAMQARRAPPGAALYSTDRTATKRGRTAHA
jgi:hypothetical protein